MPRHASGLPVRDPEGATSRDAMRANVAVQHAILTVPWHMATTGTPL